MPLREHRGLGPVMYEPVPERQEEQAPTAGDVWSSAWHLENDMAAWYDHATKPVFQPTPGFDLTKTLKDKGLWEDREHFLSVGSYDELDYVAGQLAEERQRRETLERAGWAGIGAAVATGIASPTMFIPLTAGGRGARAVVEGLALGAGAGVAQEAPLQMTQYERSGTETAIGIGASTVIGGLLGGAVGYLGRDEMEKFVAQMEADMAVVRGNATIPTSAGAARAVGEEGGRLIGADGRVMSVLTKQNPPARVLSSDQPASRWMMGQFSDGGLALEGSKRGITPSDAGTVENAVGPWYGRYWEAATLIDDRYANLVFEGTPPRIAQNLRAAARGMLGSKMSKREFRAEVARAMFNGDEHEIAQIRDTAKFIRDKLWNPLYDEAVRVGIFSGNEEVLADPSHMLRQFNKAAVAARRTEFVDILARNRETQLVNDFAKAQENFVEQDRKVQEFIEDVRRPQEEVDRLRGQFTEELEALEEARAAETVEIDGEAVALDEIEDQILELRRFARQAKANGDTAARKQYLADARDLEQRAGDPLRALKKDRAGLRRRLKNLSRSEVVLEERHAKKLAQIEKAEEQNINTLRRVIRAGRKTQRDMDRWSDEKLDAEVSKLRDRFAAAGERLDRTEERLAKLADGETPEMQEMLATAARQDTDTMRLTEIAEALGQAEDLDREFIRRAIDEALEETLRKMNGVISRRALRQERLMEQAKKLDPKTLDDHIARRLEKTKQRELSLNESYRLRGADTVDIRAGTADFARYARDVAEETTDKILGTWLRLPTVDILQQARGSEIARALNVPTSEIWDFVEQDVETLMRAYLRTMAPDVEIMRRMRPTGVSSFDWREMARPIVEEQRERVKAVDDAVDSKGNPRSNAWKEKERTRINADYAASLRDIEATISRLRHTWGLPDDPEGMGFRLAKVAMNLNTLRLMGSVTISSLPDLARPVMKYGLMNTFRDGWGMFVRGFDEVKASMRETKLAGEGTDVVTHTRAAAVADIIDDMGRGSKFERGLEFATNRMGITALFDYWTSGMKMIAGGVVHAQLLRHMQTIVEGGSAKSVQEATEFLARNGITGQMARGMWEQVVNGGGGKINGTWLPNTEDWADQDLVRAYRSAVSREVKNTIITPGAERPLFTNQTMLGRLLTQFQSFMWSSTSKTVMASMQQRDMAVLNGAVFSLALGAASYYFWAMSVGGQAKEEMLKFDPDKWADEAITRSGLIGVGDYAQRLAERIPATSPYATFSGQRTTRRGGDELLGLLGGPSLDLLANAGAVITGLDDPTQSTVNAARRMTPYQNVFYLRGLFESAAEAVPVPETRR